MSIFLKIKTRISIQMKKLDFIVNMPNTIKIRRNLMFDISKVSKVIKMKFLFTNQKRDKQIERLKCQ
jgi:hypothetical protein